MSAIMARMRQSQNSKPNLSVIQKLSDQFIIKKLLQCLNTLKHTDSHLADYNSVYAQFSCPGGL